MCNDYNTQTVNGMLLEVRKSERYAIVDDTSLNGVYLVSSSDCDNNISKEKKEELVSFYYQKY